MFSLRGFELFRLILVILVSLVSLFIFSFYGYCDDDWVYVDRVDSNEYFSLYYRKSSVKVNKQDKILKVWVKRVYTEKGRIDYLKNFTGIKNQKQLDMNHTLILYLLDYNDWKSIVTHKTVYSKSGKVLDDGGDKINWNDIQPNSVGDILFNKILKDYNIQR
jgi:hypothetical protein